jgi:hypothetical protein
VSIECASIVASWPGAEAQAYHQDIGAESEAALYLFIPLEQMTDSPGGAGPPEFCMCTHSRTTFAKHTSNHRCDGPKLVCGGTGTHNIKLDLGAAIVFDPGLVHRGLPNNAPAGTDARQILHLSLTPEGANIRTRPQSELGGSVAAHLSKWRAINVYTKRANIPGEAGATGGWRGASSDHIEALPPQLCSGFQSCTSCRAGNKGTAHSSVNGEWRTGCAWCTDTQQCVPDLAGMCLAGSSAHVGDAGLGKQCEAVTDHRTEL